MRVLPTVRTPVSNGRVYCPRRQQWLELAECTRCPRCQCFSNSDGTLTIVCRMDPGPLPARSLLKGGQ